MTSSDVIQLVSAIASFSLGFISICIALATLIQTNKITEESNRPYIAIYLDVISVTDIHHYLVVKNFGNTGAIIDSISYSPPLESKYNVPFSKVKNHFLAPNQKMTTVCKFEKPYVPITFTIKYHAGKKSYSEDYVINPDSAADMLIMKSSNSSFSQLEKVISYSVQEIIRTNL